METVFAYGKISLFQYFFFQFNPNFRICSFSKKFFPDEKKKRNNLIPPSLAFIIFLFFFLSSQWRKIIEPVTGIRFINGSKRTFDLDQNGSINSSFHPLVELFFAASTGRRPISNRNNYFLCLIPFGKTTHRMENVPRNCFYVATIHQSENFISEWETNRLLFKKDDNFVDKILWDFHFIPFFFLLLDSLKIEESKKKDQVIFFYGYSRYFLNLMNANFSSSAVFISLNFLIDINFQAIWEMKY